MSWLFRTSLVVALCAPAAGFSAGLCLADDAAARVASAQKQADAAIEKQQATRKVVAAARAAFERQAKARADELRLQADVVVTEKAVHEATAAIANATTASKSLEQAASEADAALEAAKAALAAAQKSAAEAAESAKATADTAAAARIAAGKAPLDKGVALLQTLADRVAADAAATASDLAARAAAAAKPVDDASMAAKAAHDSAAAGKRAIADAEAAAKAASEKLSGMKSRLAAVNRSAQETDAAIAAAKAEVEQATTAFEAVSKETAIALKAAEEALIAAGRFVSFSKQIAPIFNQQCLTCHNARKAKGRYNMESYLAVMQGGEQGDTLLPHDADGSNLLALLEDGAMPKDADPLTAEQVALVKQWIENGARLDVGVRPDAPLVAIIPKKPQPPAPEVYRVPIPVTALAFNSDGTLLASSGYHEVLLWNPVDGTLVRRIGNIAERAYDVEFSPNGKLLAVAAGTPGVQGEAKLFDPSSGRLVRDLMTTTDAAFGAAFSPDGRRLAVCSADRTIRVYHVESGDEELSVEDHADWVMDLAWSPDGEQLASASRDKTAKLFDARTGDSLATFSGHNEVVFGVAFSADGQQVFSAGRDQHIREWTPGAESKQVREVTGFGGEVYRLVATSEGTVFSCCSDKQARLHNSADGSLIRAYSGHTDRVYAIAYSPAVKMLATGSWDGEIRLWNADDGQGLQTIIAAPGYVPPKATAAR